MVVLVLRKNCRFVNDSSHPDVFLLGLLHAASHPLRVVDRLPAAVDCLPPGFKATLLVLVSQGTTVNTTAECLDPELEVVHGRHMNVASRVLRDHAASGISSVDERRERILRVKLARSSQPISAMHPSGWPQRISTSLRFILIKATSVRAAGHRDKNHI